MQTDGGGFSAQAHDAVALAREEAKRVGDHDFDTAHLLLALTRQQGTVAVHTLEKSGVDVARLQEDLESIITDRAPLHAGGRGRAVTRALQAAIEEVPFGARVTTGHVLLGVMADSEGIAAAVLARSGLSPDIVRKQVKRSRARER
jgi:ATP-dependent Clp protease ATP-binding subunit ClpC